MANAWFAALDGLIPESFEKIHLRHLCDCGYTVINLPVPVVPQVHSPPIYWTFERFSTALSYFTFCSSVSIARISTRCA